MSELKDVLEQLKKEEEEQIQINKNIDQIELEKQKKEKWKLLVNWDILINIICYSIFNILLYTGILYTSEGDPYLCVITYKNFYQIIIEYIIPIILIVINVLLAKKSENKKEKIVLFIISIFEIINLVISTVIVLCKVLPYK